MYTHTHTHTRHTYTYNTYTYIETGIYLCTYQLSGAVALRTLAYIISRIYKFHIHLYICIHIQYIHIYIIHMHTHAIYTYIHKLTYIMCKHQLSGGVALRTCTEQACVGSYISWLNFNADEQVLDGHVEHCCREAGVCVCVGGGGWGGWGGGGGCVCVYVCVSRRHLNVDEQISDVHVEDCCRDAGVCVCLWIPLYICVDPVCMCIHVCMLVRV